MIGGINVDDPIWKLTPLVDHTAPNYHFEWEREWRRPGGLRFAPDDVAFLFVPDQDDEHERAKRFFETGGDGAGPAYSCPVLDPLWDAEKLAEELGAVS